MTTTRRRTKKPPKDRAPESIEEDVATDDDTPHAAGVTLWGADSAGFTDDALPEFATVRGTGGRHGA